MKRKHAAMRRFDNARRLAAENGGACLTTEPIGERKRFEFTCQKEHRNFLSAMMPSDRESTVPPVPWRRRVLTRSSIPRQLLMILLHLKAACA